MVIYVSSVVGTRIAIFLPDGLLQRSIEGLSFERLPLLRSYENFLFFQASPNSSLASNSLWTLLLTSSTVALH